MKKSELKALIREVVKEAMFPPMNMAVMRAIQDSGSGISIEDLEKNKFVLSNIGGLVCWKKGNLLVYSTPTPDNKDTQWRVTTQDVRGDEIPYIPYEKSVVKNMNDVLKWEKTINSKAVKENFAINHAMTQMVNKQERQKKEAYYKSKLEQYHQAAKGHWPEKAEYKGDVISLGKNLGYSDSDIHQDLNRYSKPEDEPAMNNFIFESKLKALIREVIKEAGNQPSEFYDNELYIRATGANQQAGGTSSWLKIRKIEDAGHEYVFFVKIRGEDREVGVSKEQIRSGKGIPNLKFKVGSWPATVNTVLMHYFHLPPGHQH